jgi:hypothetical protein
MSIEILDGGGPGTTSFNKIVDGGVPNTAVFAEIAEGGGAIRGEVVAAQAQTTNITGTVTSLNTGTTAQGDQHVEASGTVAITGTVSTSQAQTTHATGSVLIGSAVSTAQGSQSVNAVGTVTPYVPPIPPAPVPTLGQYGSGMHGGGGGVAGGYVISLAGFRRHTIEITVCIPGELPNTVEVQQQDVTPEVSMSPVQNTARTMQVAAHNLRNVLTKRPAWDLCDIINTTQSNTSAKVLFNQPRAQINDITTIDP